jgi:rod shape-determining protein MreC
VNPVTSWVSTLLSPECAVSALDQRSRVRGIVRWRYPAGLSLQLAAAGSDIVEGDEIISSGLGGVFPKGLEIGSVDGVEERLGELFRRVSVRAAVDFDRLEEVAVLTRETDRDSDLLLWRARSVSQDMEDSLSSDAAPRALGE